MIINGTEIRTAEEILQIAGISTKKKKIDPIEMKIALLKIIQLCEREAEAKFGHKRFAKGMSCWKICRDGLGYTSDSHD